MWTFLGLLLLLLVWEASVECKNVPGVDRPAREKVNVTFSQTVAVAKTVDTDNLAGIKPVPSQDVVKPPGCNHGPPANIGAPGPILPGPAGPMPMMPNDGVSAGLLLPGLVGAMPLMPNDGGPPAGTPEPPQFPGPGEIGGPTMPPMPPMPTGIDIAVIEAGGEGGGQLGDRCPEAMKDENGKYPDVCYDVIDENGACILDDIIAPKEDCILWFGEDFYNELVETQKKIEENRANAISDAGISTTATAPSSDEGKSEEEKEKEEAIEAEGRSVELDVPFSASRRKSAPESRPKVVRRDGPVMNTGVLDSLGYLETPMVGPTLGYFESLGRKKKDGPTFNLAALDSLGYLETPVVGPTLGYFESLGRKKKDGPTFNLAALENLGYLETPMVGPTLGYFQSLGKPKRDLGPLARREQDGPKFNENTLNELGEDSKENGNNAGYSPDSSSWVNSKVLPDAGPLKPQ